MHLVPVLLGLLLSWLDGHLCKPNLVYILLDDVGYTDMFNKNSTVPLPYMNSLLSKGIKFTNVSNYSIFHFVSFRINYL